MVDLGQLVSESLVRHGVDTRLDPNRLRWSSWFPCEDSLGLPIPNKPGLFALSEEVGSIGAVRDDASNDGARRMLALFHIAETEDLEMTLGRLTLPGNPLSRRFSEQTIFVRYAVIEDPAQRQSALKIFEHWVKSSNEMKQAV